MPGSQSAAQLAQRWRSATIGVWNSDLLINELVFSVSRGILSRWGTSHPYVSELQGKASDYNSLFEAEIV